MPIIDEHIISYVEQLSPPRSPTLLELEQIAREEGIPNITLPGASVLRMLCALHRPKRILEIGTAIGYSAIHMAEAAPQSTIVTMEMNRERAVRAADHFRKAGVDDRIELIEGDALEELPRITGAFDMIFIDAAKGKYMDFFQAAFKLCNSGGIIVTDNVLFRGLVTEEPESIDRRHRSLVRKIRHYNETLLTHPGLETVLLTVGDGMAVSIKR